MATKTQQPFEAEPKELTELEKAYALVAKAEADAYAAKPECGNVNLHWTGAEPMTCTLKVGHRGNHETPYTIANGRTETASWNDGANVPAPKHVG